MLNPLLPVGVVVSPRYSSPRVGRHEACALYSGRDDRYRDRAIGHGGELLAPDNNLSSARHELSKMTCGYIRLFDGKARVDRLYYTVGDLTAYCRATPFLARVTRAAVSKLHVTIHMSK